MTKKDIKAFLHKIDIINKSQNSLMTGFVSQKNNSTGRELKFEWDDKSLFDYVDLRFNEVKIYLRDFDKQEDNTKQLIQPINDLISLFNNRQIDFFEFTDKYKAIENNLLQAAKSEKYSISWDNYVNHYEESKATVIKGVGGMGKSHFLWECQNKIQLQDLYKSLFIYGKYFKDIESLPWKDIIDYANEKEFLLVFDGINEIADIQKRIFLYNKIKELSSCKYLRLFVSYRTYSLSENIDGQEEYLYLENLLKNTINFSGVDFDSSIMEIVSSFKVDISYFYNILYSNNPMQIRMLVESDILTDKHLYDELSDTSVVSMTFIYERFIKSACRKLWKEQENAYWNTIKNLSLVLYHANRSSFNRNDLTNSAVNIDKFINDLKNGGYIDSYDNENYFFVWEQLSNYLIARSFFKITQNKNEVEVMNLFIEKTANFPRITQFLISVLVDKYKKDFSKFISFISKAKPHINQETLLNIVIKNSDCRKMLQGILSFSDIGNLLSTFGGIPNRIFNCESYIFEECCNNKYNILKPLLNFNCSEVIRKLRSNLHNINGKCFLPENITEFLKFAFVCLLIPDKSVLELSEKTIYDILDQSDNDFSSIIMLFLDKCGSPLVKRALYNVVCHLANSKRIFYRNIIEKIKKDKNFVNAKVIVNYNKMLNLPPFHYCRFNKIDLFRKYKHIIPDVKSNFNEFKSLGGLISVIRLDKLFYSLNMEWYNELKLNFRLLDLPKNEILEFNKRFDSFSRRYNKCKCQIEVWEGMFNNILDAEKNKFLPYYTLLDQEELFYGFVAHLNKIIQYYDINDEDIKWFKDNRYKQYKMAPDNVSVLLELCAEEFIGSLMCNYFQEDCKISFWENQIFIGFSPIEYNEEQLNLCSPMPTYNEIINYLDSQVIRRLDNNYKRRKDSVWADNKKLSFKNSRSIIKPYFTDNSTWIMLCGYIRNRTYYSLKNDNRNYSEECIIVHCATNYKKNNHIALDRKKTIELLDYKGPLSDYNTESSDFCKNINTIKTSSNLFEETYLVFPPTSIISYFDLAFDLKQSAWVDKKNNVVIICNNQNYERYSDNIGYSAYIRKEYFDLIKDKLGLYYYIFTEKLSYDKKVYSDKSDMHIIIKNNRIIKYLMNDGRSSNSFKKSKRKCEHCIFYTIYQRHQLATNNFIIQSYIKDLFE